MAKMTITEALADIKTIGKRIEHHRQTITQHVAYPAMLRDPLAKEGGSEKAIASAMQSVTDLANRLVDIRLAVARANLSVNLTINDQTRTITGWLAWRREAAPQIAAMLRNVVDTVHKVREEINRRSQGTPVDITTNVQEANVAAQIEMVESLLGQLDGKLSLLNATTIIEV